MNYIKHLTAFFEMVSSDKRLYPSHVSLYMALFQFWNINHFENPVSICRKEVLQLSKIGSYNTYHRCLHDLHRFGYIKYEPSHNQFIGSLVHLYNFDTTVVQALRHSINDINVLNNKTYREEQTQNEIQKLNPKNMKTKNPITQNAKRKKVAPKKEKMVCPSLDEVITFFKSENYPEVEAKKFFNHFESNGWKVGGKTPMKNWQAAARKWMLNCKNFIPPTNFPKQIPFPKPPKPNPNNKNYAEPL